MSHILRTSTEHKTASLADEGNSAYCQSSGAHNIKHINLWKLTLRGHLNTDVQAGLELGTFRSRERCLTARPQLHFRFEFLVKRYAYAENFSPIQQLDNFL